MKPLFMQFFTQTEGHGRCQSDAYTLLRFVSDGGTTGTFCLAAAHLGFKLLTPLIKSTSVTVNTSGKFHGTSVA
jgi:hypothetical protein